jgi:hypothetical protein
MSDTTDPRRRRLDDCGCCEGLAASTPARLFNRHGLSAIAYRVGTHSLFKASLLARLSSSRLPMLAELRTRDDDDLSIALLDAWAAVGDVLSFYQERLANEAFLRTAVERLSIRELARLVGYRLSPGVAADTFLAFTLEEAPGAPDKATQTTAIDIGTRAQSTPGPDESPQIYETVEKIEGRVAWNAIKPRLTRRHLLGKLETLLFAGIETQLKAGDGVLFEMPSGTPVFGVVGAVRPKAKKGHTEVEVEYLAAAPQREPSSWYTGNPAAPSVSLPPGLSQATPCSAADLEAKAKIGKLETQAVFDLLAANPRPAPKVLVFRKRAAIFGHNAPRWETLPAPLRESEKIYNVKSNGTVELVKTVTGPYYGDGDSEGEWKVNLLSELDITNEGHVFLDQVYPDLVAGSMVVLRQGGTWAVYKVDGVTDISKSDFNLTAKVTRLDLDDHTDLDSFGIRTTTVFAHSETLDLARLPFTGAFEPDSSGWLDLDGWVDGLSVGQRVAISGTVEGEGDAIVAECHVLAKVEHDLRQEGGGTRIALEQGLANTLVRESVSINANLARATHGETVASEVLGSGDGRHTYQELSLAQSPLTHVSADTTTGTESTLEVRVNDILWKEVETLYGKGPEDRIFVTRDDDDGTTSVRFGDGRTGSRLPTGQSNVRARYRKGIGVAGRVKAGQLDVLMQRPLGVKEVVNPAAASGGGDPELREQARRNAPLKILTLDRVVSLRDYEDFARAFAGIDKALATWTWNGSRRGIFVTVAGADGAVVQPGSTLHNKLAKAMTKAGDPHLSVRIACYRPALFRVAVRILVDPDYLEEKVLAAVELSLRSSFAFDVRELGQPVAKSEVIAAIQSVAGVVALDLDALYRGGTSTLDSILAAAIPAAGAYQTPEAAELLTLHPAPLDALEVMS